MRRLVPFAVAALLGLSGIARSEPLPLSVSAAIKEQKAACAPEHSALDKGFLTRRDINGDGVPDYILDYGKFRCGESVSFFCGSAGCTTQVFASQPGGGFANVLDENVRDIRFQTIAGRPAMVLELHGSACGKAGIEPCDATLLWDGSTFKRGH